MASSKNTNLNLTIHINGKEVKNNFNAVKREMYRLRREVSKATRGTEEYKRKSEELKKVTKIYKNIKEEINGVPSLLEKVKDKLGGIAELALGVFAVDRIMSYGKAIFESVNQLRKLKGAIGKLGGVSENSIDKVTVKIKSLSDVFEKDTSKMSESANNFAKQYGEDFGDVLELIQQGFLEGADANDEFLDKLKEYPPLLKETGLSAKQVIALMTQEVKQGIYSDKGVDAIKEANLRLREMPKSTIEALKALGFSSKKLQKELRDGSKTTFDVIQMVSKRMASLPSQSTIVGQSIADIFGGPGEDAGIKYLSNLYKIDLSMKDTIDTSDKFTQAKKLELEATESLNNLYIQFTDTGNSLNITWQKLKIQFANSIGYLLKLTGITNGTDGSIIRVRENLKILIKILTVAGTAFFSYTAAVKLMTIWKERATKGTILNTLAVRANAIGMGVARSATLAYQVVTALLTGNIKKATLAMRSFSVVTKLNPIGLLVSAISAAVVAYNLFSESTDKASVKQKALNAIKIKASKIIAEEESSLKKLLVVAKDEKLSKDERKKAIEKLNKLSPKYLGNLTLENIGTREATKAIDLYVSAMKKRAEQKAVEQLIDETIKERKKEEAKNLKDNVKWYDYLTSSIKSFGNQAMASANIAASASERKSAKISALVEKEKAYIEQYKKGLHEKKLSDVKQLEIDKKFQQIRNTLLETARKLRIKNIEKLTNEQLRVEIQKAIERNNKLSQIDSKASDKEAKKRQKRLQEEKEYRDEILLSTKTLYEQAIVSYQNMLKLAGLYGKDRESLTKDELKVLEVLEKQHKVKIAQIELSETEKFLEAKKKKYEKERDGRREAFNNELNEIKSFSVAKEQLSKTLGYKELSEIKTLKKAKSALERQHEVHELQKQAEYLQSIINLYTTALKTGEIEGVNFADNILTEEQKEILNSQLEQVRLKLSEINAEKNKTSGKSEEESSDLDLSGTDDVDLFGFSPEQWQDAFSNLDKAKGKVAAMSTVLTGLQNAWGMYNQFVAQAEAKQLKEFEKKSEKRKIALKKQLDSGIIDQETYNKKVEEIDNELAKKKAEIEYKQAKREKDMAIANVAIQTASAIMSIWAQVPKGDFGISAGLMTGFVTALGAAKIGLIASTPLPDRGYKYGGFTEGLGYRDHTGDEVAGVVHADEYVVPKFVMNSTDPAVPQVIQYLEHKRKEKIGYFNTGGHTSTPVPKFSESDDTGTSESTKLMELILIQYTRLNDHLDNGIIANTLIGDNEIHRYKTRQEKLNNSRNNAKIQ
ncbi:Phage tail protein [Tenacibaculum sp. 190524A02b]|uniref:Phage tail protein n=1 Tax=Tenacibaculum vairaonense TaxID=3137860 RepID=A0ABM9PIM3_9FLAO